ncbi:unnamed protein product [Cercopithifilaria johnstoni]|uniref:Fungal lipase-type domain-containing protein n=1 Tax=Cercopithifilaria johnstoni TaxID=2874296 RepID=A0A8J2M261_9BILA|nr:unnamed protein product [Cercopithifilaria johnstoni]
MLQITLLLFVLCVGINGDNINDCTKYKDCVSCVKSRRLLPEFQRYCGWHTDKSSCGEPFAIIAGSNVVVREPFMCPENEPIAKKYRYTDKLGRLLYGLILAVRNEAPTKCLANSHPDVQLIKRYEVECDQSHNLCAAMLAISKPDKRIYIVYKSINMDKQLIAEFIHIIAAQLGVWEKFEAGGGVLTYFHAAFERLFKRSGMKNDLIKLKETYPNYEVWCTGHSLGASLSSMTALYLVKNKVFPAKLVRLVTFGEPRTGNVAFAQAVEENVKVRYRVVHRGDPITNMPALLNPFALLLSSTVAERQPYFYRYLIFYDNDMNEGSTFSICTLSEDSACRNLAFANNALDHTNYFAVNADTYLSKECKGDLLRIIGNRKTAKVKTAKIKTATLTGFGTTDIATTDTNTSDYEDNNINTITNSTSSDADTVTNAAHAIVTGATTPSDVATTVVDTNTTAADTDTTADDIDTVTVVDADTTDAVAETTAAYADTTAAKANTTATYADTTAAKANTTAAYADTTAANGNTTAAYADTTDADADTAAVDADTAAVDADTTAVDADTTAPDADTAATDGDSNVVGIDTTVANVDTNATTIAVSDTTTTGDGIISTISNTVVAK